MSAYEFPNDLIEIQRDYEQANARVEKLVAALPSALDVMTGKPKTTDKQQDEVQKAREVLLQAQEKRDQHPWLQDIDDQYAARMQLWKAARSSE
ncbi:hypothetical protein [Streptosporangium subroseum]|uniref:hypothetical protein n=1 Tax=Streptosporangium subroseum TaxID=106412 RepID=UPI00308DE190|nr:hypothetical protein OHB15_18235 [Streptosporangium subroseum]